MSRARGIIKNNNLAAAEGRINDEVTRRHKHNGEQENYKVADGVFTHEKIYTQNR